MSVPNGTPIYRIESRLVIPTLRVPNPSEEQWDGQAITETLLNKKFGRGIGGREGQTRQRDPGGNAGTHWSTSSTVPRNYGFDDLLRTVQTGVPMSRHDRRQIRRKTPDDGRSGEHKTYSDYSGKGLDLRPFTARVLWHGSIGDPENAKKTSYTWEHEVDLEHDSIVPIHGFSYSIPKPGQAHLASDQFKYVSLDTPINMTIGRHDPAMSYFSPNITQGARFHPRQQRIDTQ